MESTPWEKPKRTAVSTAFLPRTEVKKNRPSGFIPLLHCLTLIIKILQMQPFSECKGIVCICKEQLFFMLPNS